jgi:hypothetical protein
LVDFQCLDPERAPELLRAMLGKAVERSREESLHMVELAGVTPELEHALKQTLPHKRELSSWLFYYKTRNAALGEQLQDPAVWEPSLFDGDSSL